MNYTARVKVSVDDERSGKPKSHTEVYLIQGAVSPGDVEVYITQEFEGFSGDWEITNISTSNIVKVLNPESVEKFNA